MKNAAILQHWKGINKLNIVAYRQHMGEKQKEVKWYLFLGHSNCQENLFNPECN